MSSSFSLPQSQQEIKPDANHNVKPAGQEGEKADFEIINRLRAERDRLRIEVDLLRVEQAKTALALAEITAERNTYHRELLRLTRQEVTISKEELEEALKNAVSLEDTIREMESVLLEKD